MGCLGAYSAGGVRVLEGAVMAAEGISSNALMERAGAAAFECARRRFPQARRWLVLAGAGNNAGDGFVIARLAKNEGLEAQTLLVSPSARPKGDAAAQFEAMAAAGAPAAPFAGGPLPECDLIVDAMLGIGLDRPLAGRYLEAARAVNASAAPALAVDIPTGIHADNGTAMGAAVQAAITVTFIAWKCGLFLGDAPDYAGECVLESLGRIPPQQLAEAEAKAEAAANPPPILRIFPEQLRRAMLPPRRRADHKGRFGHVLVVGGGAGMGGAALLAGEGALRAGAGLVSVATHPEHAAELLEGRPELMVRGVRRAADLTPLLERASVAAVGCGLGRDAWARELFAAVCASALPRVIDADGLNLLAEAPPPSAAPGNGKAEAPPPSAAAAPSKAEARPTSASASLGPAEAPLPSPAPAAAPGNAPPLIITPHPGEAARLLGRSSAQAQADRLGTLAELKQRTGATVLLKGAHTLVSGGKAPPWVINAGNPGMATAGMGDVLTGLLAGLWAQLPHAPPEDIAALAAHTHARAGDLAARPGQRGMIAGDLLTALRQSVNPHP